MSSVFIIYGEDGYNNATVEKVFADRDVARKYVIDEILRAELPREINQREELNTRADEYIDEFTVIYE